MSLRNRVERSKGDAPNPKSLAHRARIKRAAVAGQQWPTRSWWPSITCFPTESAPTALGVFIWISSTSTTSRETWFIDWSAQDIR